MLRLNLYLITVSISVRGRESMSMAQHYEDRIRVNRLIEEVNRKRDERIRIF
ncbi:MAG TPA: hypothetical protein VFT51_10165 [Bacillales bacterium]|nr:hypothetical protein [Bacillales bacterium]